MIAPNTGSLALSGLSPRIVIDTRLVPGEASLVMRGQQALPELEQNSLLTELPYMLSTFSESRRIIRQTYDEIRDVIFQNRDNEVYLVLELDGGLYDASFLGEIQLECTNANGIDTAAINSTSNPTLFDIKRRVSVRGQAINALVLVINEAAVSQFFTVGLWTIEIFAVDAVNPAGVHWGMIEWEVRSLFEGIFITPLTGGLNLDTVSAPRVTYRNIRPDTASLSLTGNTPTIRNSTAGLAATASVGLDGQQPVITINTNRTPSVGSITVTGIAPIRTP